MDNKIEYEILKAKRKIKDLKKLRKLYRKTKRLELKPYRNPYDKFIDLLDNIFLGLKNLIEAGK